MGQGKHGQVLELYGCRDGNRDLRAMDSFSEWRDMKRIVFHGRKLLWLPAC